jgi:hypothetical protein
LNWMQYSIIILVIAYSTAFSVSYPANSLVNCLPIGSVPPLLDFKTHFPLMGNQWIPIFKPD